MSQKFYKTIFTFEVLSEKRLPGDLDLVDINQMTYDGNCVGRFGETRVIRLSGKEAADALYEFGSEPGFFQLDDDGNEEEEGED